MVTKNEGTWEKPRIISEVRKKCLMKSKSGFSTSRLNDFAKPKISGWISWKAFSREWILIWAEVKRGNLFFGPSFRLPLRRLHLQPCQTPRTFRLSRGPETPSFTFRLPTEEEYEKWVKTLAIELIKQTPLHDVPFLDIISITGSPVDTEKNSVEAKKKKNRCAIGAFFSKAITFREKSSQDRKILSVQEEDLNYLQVSVKEKKRFFESLNSEKEIKEPKKWYGTVCRHEESEKVSDKPVPVREITRFFEAENQVSFISTEKDTLSLLDRRRLQRGERKLSKLKIQTTEVEEEARTLFRDIETVRANFFNGNEKEELSATLIRRLNQENSRLERLKEETALVVAENWRILKKLECSAVK